MPWQSTINEFFVRLHDDGSGIRGMHVAERTAFFENGVEITGTAKLLPPRPVTLADTQALAEIGAAFNLATAATVSQQDAAITALEVERDAAVAAQQAAQEARDTALAEAQALRDKYETSTDNNGVPVWVYRVQAVKAMLDTPKSSPFGATMVDYVEGTLRALAAQSLDGRKLLADFLESARFYRNHPSTLQMIAGGLMTSAEADALWIKAAAIVTAPT